jgi:hypothetical protein
MGFLRRPPTRVKGARPRLALFAEFLMIVGVEA